MDNLATSFDRTRAYWTPTMDSFFIDLMVDHMNRGNKIGHTFNKQAWAEMHTVFNAKFGFQYDKDFLKNQYSTLWKQFNDIKNILDQSGFCWDDSRHMVVADDFVWDTFIKAHPDARYYRNKVVMNFSGLCLIYAYTTADGRYSRSSHDVDFDDEAQGMNIGDEKEVPIPTVGNSSRPYWTPQMDSYLIDLLLNQVQRGNRIGNGLVTEAWNEIATLFNEKFGSHFGKKVFKNQYNDLRQQFNDLKILLDQSGFSWDESREMVTAEDHVWDSYTKVYPDARLYKFKTVPSYHKLSVIYGDEVSNGRSSPTPYYLELDDSYSSKEDWMPSMDRYLIDLMLEQVHRGHMIDPIFNKQPWIDIVAAFNDRFGSHYDKYILSGRHKILRKLYDDMKNLLDFSEFSWDEKRHLVTACDDVWDSYVEVHPGVKSFKTKTEPSYNDLCLIYGNLNSDKRCNELDQDMNFNGNGRDIHALQNGSYHRNSWNPPMDRYFIDLMLEQICKGSMVNQKFSKQAWADILLKFNANFGFQHRKDDLESHFKILRNTFNDMKSLLDQNGFEWDELHQMITANDDLWDAFVADNPYAQSYRSRTLPNYNDLFLIYGSTTTTGVENHSDHFINDNENGLGLPFGQYDDDSSAGSDSVGIDWTTPMDQFLIELMSEQVFEGNNIDSTLNTQAWVHVMKSFNETFGLHCDKYVMGNRYRSLMKQYEDIKSILNQNGFVWDEFQQMIMAEDDVWEAYIEEHPDAAIYKDKTFDSYNNLSIIFRNGIQDRQTEFKPITREEMEMDDLLEDLQSLPRNIEIHDQTKKRRTVASLTLPSSRKRRRARKESEEGKNYRSMETIVDALEAVPDMDDELFLDACNLLEDEKRAKAFVNMDIAQRRRWLLRKLRV